MKPVGQWCPLDGRVGVPVCAPDSIPSETDQSNGVGPGLARGGGPRVGGFNPVGIGGRIDLAEGIWESKVGPDPAAFVERYLWGTGCR